MLLKRYATRPGALEKGNEPYNGGFQLILMRGMHLNTRMEPQSLPLALHS